MNELRELRERRNIPRAEIINFVQRYSPKFDKAMLSKCENSERYGATISRFLMNAIIAEFAPDELPEIKKQRDGRHRLTRRIQCRLEETDYHALRSRIAADGYKTTQDWLTDTVRRYLENERSSTND